MLAACGQDAPREDAAPASPVPEIAQPTAPPTATSPIPAPEVSPTDLTIPAALQGRWGLVPADCTSTRGDAKGLLTIGPATLRFYESHARLEAVKEREESRIAARFAFSGEGMEWRRDMVLDAQGGGKVLIRREFGTDAAPGGFRYVRCK